MLPPVFGVPMLGQLVGFGVDVAVDGDEFDFFGWFGVAVGHWDYFASHEYSFLCI
jgi:hypothetical protein